MYINTNSTDIMAQRPYPSDDDRNIKSIREVAADAIAKRRSSQMADALEADRKIPIPGLLINRYYAEQPGAKILPDGVVELPN